MRRSPTAWRRCRAGLPQQIVRLVVFDVPRTVARELDHAADPRLEGEALHFHLDLRRPVRTARDGGRMRPGRRQTLPEVVRDWLGDRVLPG